MRHGRLARRLFIVLGIWFANSVIVYGMIFNIQNLSGSIYLNFIITLSVDLLVSLVMVVSVNRLGRKKTHSFNLFVSSVACLAVLIPAEVASAHVLNLSVTVLSMISKASIIAAYYIMFLYTSEMFPTTLRGSALGLASMAGSIGSIAAPYVADLGILVGGHFEASLPLIVFGGVGLVAATSSLFLPETTGLKLPGTIDEALAIGR